MARLRERGHTLEQIREASESGLLALGDVEDFLRPDGRHTLAAGRPRQRPRAGVIERIIGPWA